MVISVILVTIFAVQSVVSQVTSSGQCVIFDSKGKFSMAQFYSGTWYLIEGYPNRYYKENSLCQEWTLSSDAKYVYITESVFDVKEQIYKNLTGSARFSKKGNSNHLVLLPGLKSLPYGAHVWVTSTDYNNYAVVYICEQAKKSRREYIYILSRVPTLRPALRARILINNIVKGGFPVAPLASMNQLDCPPLPALNKPPF